MSDERSWPAAGANAANVRRNPIPVTPGFDAIYSHAVEVPPASRLLFISGQIGTTARGDTPRDFKSQFEQAIANLFVVLGSADMTCADLVRLTFFVTRAEDLRELGDIRRRLLDVSPAVTTLVVAGLARPDLLVEVEAVAARQTVTTA